MQVIKFVLKHELSQYQRYEFDSQEMHELKCIPWMQCKSLWIKVSAECIQVNVYLLHYWLFCCTLQNRLQGAPSLLMLALQQQLSELRMDSGLTCEQNTDEDLDSPSASSSGTPCLYESFIPDSVLQHCTLVVDIFYYVQMHKNAG